MKNKKNRLEALKKADKKKMIILFDKAGLTIREIYRALDELPSVN